MKLRLVVYLAIKQASCSLTPHGGEISFESIACFKILKHGLDYCLSVNGRMCVCMCEEGRHLKSLQAMFRLYQYD